MRSELIELKLRQEELKRLGRLQCRVVSGSMEPLIRVGELIQVEPIESIDRIKRFDILVFLGTEGFFCHFAWHVTRWSDEPLIATRSLQNPFESDVPVPFDRVLGVLRERRVPTAQRLGIPLRNGIRHSL